MPSSPTAGTNLAVFLHSGHLMTVASFAPAFLQPWLAYTRCARQKERSQASQRKGRKSRMPQPSNAHVAEPRTSLVSMVRALCNAVSDVPTRSLEDTVEAHHGLLQLPRIRFCQREAQRLDSI